MSSSLAASKFLFLLQLCQFHLQVLDSHQLAEVTDASTGIKFQSNGGDPVQKNERKKKETDWIKRGREEKVIKNESRFLELPC